MHFILDSIWSCFIYSKKSRIGHCIFFMTDYIQSNFVFNIGVPREYLDFFDSGKIRICVFYMREHMELVYSPKQRKIGHCIFFLTDYIQSNFVFSIGVPR